MSDPRINRQNSSPISSDMNRTPLERRESRFKGFRVWVTTSRVYHSLTNNVVTRPVIGFFKDIGDRCVTTYRALKALPKSVSEFAKNNPWKFTVATVLGFPMPFLIGYLIKKSVDTGKQRTMGPVGPDEPLDPVSKWEPRPEVKAMIKGPFDGSHPPADVVKTPRPYIPVLHHPEEGYKDKK